MILGLCGSLNQFVDNMLRGRMVRIPHPKINDVLACPAGFHLHFIESGK